MTKKEKIIYVVIAVVVVIIGALGYLKLSQSKNQEVTPVNSVSVEIPVVDILTKE